MDLAQEREALLHGGHVTLHWGVSLATGNVLWKVLCLSTHHCFLRAVLESGAVAKHSALGLEAEGVCVSECVRERVYIKIYF